MYCMFHNLLNILLKCSFLDGNRYSQTTYYFEPIYFTTISLFHQNNKITQTFIRTMQHNPFSMNCFTYSQMYFFIKNTNQQTVIGQLIHLMMRDILLGMHLNILKWFFQRQRIHRMNKDFTHLFKFLRRIEFNIMSRQDSHKFIEINVTTSMFLYHLRYSSSKKLLNLSFLSLGKQWRCVSISSHLQFIHYLLVKSESQNCSHNEMQKINISIIILNMLHLQLQIHTFNLFVKIILQLNSILKMSKIAVWLDCDPGLDDTFAIIYAAHAEQIDLIGISTGPGNTSLANTTKNALDILYNIGRKDVPVFAGSNQLIKGDKVQAQHVHGNNGLGGVEVPSSTQQAITQASFQKIYKRIMKVPGKIKWTNTGSFTNLCILLLAFPDVKQKIEEIVIMGGAIGQGNRTPAAEFNILFDPCAFEQVLSLKGNIPLVMIPLEVTHQNLGTQNVYNRIKQISNIPLGKAVYEMILVYQQFYIQAHQMPYPPFHDPLTIFYILHPQQFDKSRAVIKVDTFPTSYGRTNIYFWNAENIDVDKSVDFVTTNLRNEKVMFWDEMFKIFNKIFTEQFQHKIHA